MMTRQLIRSVPEYLARINPQIVRSQQWHVHVFCENDVECDDSFSDAPSAIRYAIRCAVKSVKYSADFCWTRRVHVQSWIQHRIRHFIEGDQNASGYFSVCSTVTGVEFMESHWNIIRIMKAIAANHPNMSPINVADRLPQTMETVLLLNDIFYTCVRVYTDNMPLHECPVLFCSEEATWTQVQCY